jgi:phospholipid/cholesterol/gamma-HCH transport system substrate-binding protein
MSELYKDQRQVELKVGIVVIILIVGLIVGYAWLRNVLQLKDMTDLQVRFSNAQGLQIGDKVTVNGMESGRVKKIVQLQDGVLVQSQLKLQFPLLAGCRFIIKDSNLMGGKQLEIVNGSAGQKLEIGRIQEGENSVGMDGLISEAAVAMRSVNELLTALNQPDGILDKAGGTLTSAETTIQNANSVIDANKAKLAGVLAQIDTTTRKINEILVSSQPNLDRALALTPEVMQKTKATLDSLQVTGKSLDDAIKSMTKGKGSLPQLINDEKLYKNLLDTNARLDSLLIDIKKNPTRYFKIKVF